jgi:hypothetical protein
MGGTVGGMAFIGRRKSKITRLAAGMAAYDGTQAEVPSAAKRHDISNLKIVSR